MATNSSQQRKFGILISYISLIASILIYILYTPFLLKKIGDTQYGIKAFVDSITSFMSILSVSMSSSYVRFATIQEKTNGDSGKKAVNGIFAKLFLVAALIALVVGIIVFLLMKLSVIPLSNYSNDEKDLIFTLYLLSLLIVLVNIIVTIFTLFQEYNQKYIWLRSAALLATILRPVISIPFLLSGCNVVIVSWCILAVDFVFLLANFSYSFFHLRMRFSFAKNETSKILTCQIITFSSFILLNVISDEVNSNVDKIILGFFATPVDVTIYQIGMMFSTYLVMASVAISSSFAPRVNELVFAGDIAGVNKLFLKVAQLQIVVILTIVGGFAVCGKDFVVAWVGSSKVQSFYIGLILLALNSVPLTENLGIEVQRAMNKHKFRAISYFIIAIVNFLISLLFVYFLPKDKAVYGCLLGTIFAGIAGTWVVMNIYNRKVIKLDIKNYIISYLKYLLLTGVSVGICYLIFYFNSLAFLDNYWLIAVIKGFLFVALQALFTFLVFFKRIQEFLKRLKSGHSRTPIIKP